MHRQCMCRCHDLFRLGTAGPDLRSLTSQPLTNRVRAAQRPWVGLGTGDPRAKWALTQFPSLPREGPLCARGGLHSPCGRLEVLEHAADEPLDPPGRLEPEAQEDRVRAVALAHALLDRADRVL